MNPKIGSALFATAMLVVMALFFVFNPSYEKSLEAKYFYTMGEYKKAYKLSSEALTLDKYNKMATTIASQSKRSLLFVEFIEEAKSYMQEIERIASGDGISSSDRAKMKMMSEIVLDRYKKLSPSALTNRDLIEEALHYKEKFQSIHEKVTQWV